MDFKKGLDVYGQVHIGATTVLCSQMRLLNHLFGEVGCDSMTNKQAPHRLYATQDKQQPVTGRRPATTGEIAEREIQIQLLQIFNFHKNHKITPN